MHYDCTILTDLHRGQIFKVLLFLDFSCYNALTWFLSLLQKEHRKKCTEYEQLRKVSTKLQEEVKILRSMLQERDQLIQVSAYLLFTKLCAIHVLLI